MTADQIRKFVEEMPDFLLPALAIGINEMITQLQESLDEAEAARRKACEFLLEYWKGEDVSVDLEDFLREQGYLE